MAVAALDNLARDLASPEWRLRNLYWIIDKHGQRVRFEPNIAQEELIRSLSERDVILKARQLGFTTLCCLIGLDEALFNANWAVAIIAHKLDDAKAIFASKVKFPYDNLPDALRSRIPSISDRADALQFGNGSSITVTTSARSGTLQRLHISEFGKICARYPEKAREIVTGSFPAAEHGCITVESTAEGQDGKFYEITQAARSNYGKSGTRKDWKFHFHPWWSDTGNRLDAQYAVISAEHQGYFAKLKFEHKIDLTPEQKAWYVATEQDLGGDMKRENPSTADEAFDQAVEGAYFGPQLAFADKHGMIGRFPYDPRFPVNTFWDLGRNDLNTIWLHQRIGQRNRFIGYHENSGEHISYYARWLREWKQEHEAEWGAHYWPHDGARQDLFLENGRLGEAEKHGLRPRIVPRVAEKMVAVDAARSVFPSCDFDEASCSLGMKRLRLFRKEWDEQRGVWRDRPLHDENSHGADAFMTFATGYHPPDIYAADDDYREEQRGRNDVTGY